MCKIIRNPIKENEARPTKMECDPRYNRLKLCLLRVCKCICAIFYRYNDINIVRFEENIICDNNRLVELISRALPYNNNNNRYSIIRSKLSTRAIVAFD